MFILINSRIIIINYNCPNCGSSDVSEFEYGGYTSCTCKECCHSWVE